MDERCEHLAEEPLYRRGGARRGNKLGPLNREETGGSHDGGITGYRLSITQRSRASKLHSRTVNLKSVSPESSSLARNHWRTP